MERQTKIDLLETMLRIRKLELHLAMMFRHGRLPSGAHLSEGQEAVPAGVCANLRTDDCITSTHRGHGHCLAKGMDIKALMAEVCGKRTGCCGGKGGTMHMFDPRIGIMGTVGIVGSGIPISTGIGLYLKMKKTDRVAISFFGDGASNNGAFHESLNMASLWKLPVIYVCENNQYATSVAVWRSTSVKDISVRGAAYNMPGITVDGNHVDEVYAAAEEAIKRARAGEGPTLIECKTYRIRGHYEGDDTWDYRTREEVAAARARDAIEYWKGKLIAEGIIDEAGFQEMSERIDDEIEETDRYVEESSWPSEDDLLALGGPRPVSI